MPLYIVWDGGSARYTSLLLRVLKGLQRVQPSIRIALYDPGVRGSCYLPLQQLGPQLRIELVLPRQPASLSWCDGLDAIEKAIHGDKHLLHLDGIDGSRSAVLLLGPVQDLRHRQRLRRISRGTGTAIYCVTPSALRRWRVTVLRDRDLVRVPGDGRFLNLRRLMGRLPDECR